MMRAKQGLSDRRTRAGWSALAWLACSFAVSSQHADAQEVCVGQRLQSDVSSDQHSLRQLLDGRRFEELEAEFRRRQLAFEAGTYGEEALYYSFQTFQVRSNAVTALLKEWLDKYRLSYAAHLALAEHLLAMGQATRGSKVAKETSAEQFELMEPWMLAAQANARAALSLTKTPISAYPVSIDIELFIGKRPDIDALYEAALRAAPHSVYSRESYLLAIDSRWHGSLSDVTAALREIEHSDLPEESKRTLLYAGALQLGKTFSTDKQYDLAARSYRAAASYCVVSEPWRALSNLYNDTEQWKDAIDALDNYLRLEPDTAWAIRRKAYAYQRLGDWDHANPLYLGAAELGDSYAANAYGWSLYTGRGMTRDLDAAIKWFRLSSNQGDANAQVNLVRALREKSPER